MSQDPGCPADFWLEAHSAGEATPPEVAAHLGTCPRCQAKVEAERGASAAHLERHPPRPFRDQVLARRQRQRRTRRARAAGLGVSLAATALLVVVAWPRGSPEDVSLKGSPFQVFIKRAGSSQVEVATPNSRVGKGDALRFGYRATAPGYLLIVDVDATRAVQTFYPTAQGDAAPVKVGDEPLLPGTIALDGTPGPEHLFAVFRPRPFSASLLAGGLRFPDDGGPPSLECPDCTVSALSLQREPSR